jgi:hypothetical protein
MDNVQKHNICFSSLAKLLCVPEDGLCYMDIVKTIDNCILIIYLDIWKKTLVPYGLE